MGMLGQGWKMRIGCGGARGPNPRLQSCTGEWKVNRGVHKWKAKAGIFRLSATPNCKTHETVYSSVCAPVKPTLLLHLLQGTSKSQVHTGTSKHAWPPESAWRSVQRGSGKAPVQSCCYSQPGSVEVQCVAWTLVFCLGLLRHCPYFQV
jgi:hypothetical protein